MVTTTGDSKTPVISVKKIWNVLQAILTKAKKIKRLAVYNNNSPFGVYEKIFCVETGGSWWQTKTRSMLLQTSFR